MLVRKDCDFSLPSHTYGLPKTMCKDLLYAAGKEPVKDRKRDPYAFFMMSSRNRKFEISCSAFKIVIFPKRPSL